MSVPCLQNRVATVLLGMPDSVRASAEATLALHLAAQIDACDAVPQASKELRSVLELLRGWASEQANTGDPLDDLAARRGARLSDATG